MTTPGVSLAGTASYLPENIVENDFFGDPDAPRAAMFRGVRQRRHVSEHETSSTMIAAATRSLFERLDKDLTEIDLLLTNVTVPDVPMFGCGAAVALDLGVKPKQILDVHNAGCVSFVYMMQLARDLMLATGAETALIANAQTAGGRVFSHPENRVRAQAVVPGDGAGVGLLVRSDESPIRSVVTNNWPEYAHDMRAVADDGRSWWSPGACPFYVDFDESRMASIASRGNKLVPEAVRQACKEAGMGIDEIDMLVTNQPSNIFLRNWREALLLPPEKQVHTFEEHGNLFGAAIPIAFERAVETGAVKDGDTVVFGGFSHAGDYSAAAVIDWKTGS
jgi:3-oxoacyl-[acyl-carrier-protein] synthase-3